MTGRHWPGTDRPTSGPVAHVFTEQGDGRCVCGLERYTGVHVGRDCGHPDIDMAAVRRELDHLEADLGDRIEKVRRMLAGGWGA
jgi:hypothetical protein